MHGPCPNALGLVIRYVLCSSYEGSTRHTETYREVIAMGESRVTWYNNQYLRLTTDHQNTNATVPSISKWISYHSQTCFGVLQHTTRTQLQILWSPGLGFSNRSHGDLRYFASDFLSKRSRMARRTCRQRVMPVKRMTNALTTRRRLEGLLSHNLIFSGKSL